MRTLTSCVALVVVSLLLASCAPPAVDMAKLRQTIDAYNNMSREMWLAGTFSDSVLAFFEEDALEMPSHAPAKKGRENIRAMFTQMMGSGQKYTSFDLQEVDVQASGNIAYEIGTYRLTGTTGAEMTPFEEQGKYLSLWRMQSDGSWKLAAEIGNSDLPMPEPPKDAKK